MRKKIARILVAICCGGSAYLAETMTGEVRGTVLESETKLALAAVKATLLNVDRRWERAVETDPNGDYVFIQLEPGNYTLTFSKDTYYTVTRTDILVRLNQPKVIIPP